MTKPPRESETHMPERLWLDADVIEEYSLTEKDEEFDYQTEYIRADKYAELEKQLSAATAALKEARDKALEEAAQICQQSGTGTQIELVCKAFADSIRDLKSKRDGVE